MNATILLAAFVCGQPDDADIRVRVALALAEASLRLNAAVTVTAPDPATDYLAARSQCQRDGRPLVVFVGQPAQAVPGARCVRWDGFPLAADAESPCVVVSRDLRAGEVLTGRVEAADVAAELKRQERLAAWQQHPRNQGSCPCGQTPDGCRCSPHENCSRGLCPAQNPYLRPLAPAGAPALAPTGGVSPAVPQAFYLPAFGGACRT